MTNIVGIIFIVNENDRRFSVRRPEENERPATPLEKRKKKAAKIRLKKSRNNEK